MAIDQTAGTWNGGFSQTVEIGDVTPFRNRIANLEAQLDALSWQPITPENLPRIGDESINTRGYVMPKKRITDTWDAAKWIQNRWTHFRPINPPALERKEKP